jgi:hypothetical protein
VSFGAAVERPAAEVAEDLAQAIETCLGDRLVALYLYGSAVTGGFDPGVSDVDLVAATADQLDGSDLECLEMVHRAFVEERPQWDDRIEVVYVPASALADFRTSAAQLGVVSPGEPLHLRHEPPRAWTQNWYLLKETSRVLRGPQAKDLVPSIGWEEFVEAARQYAREIRDRADERAHASGLAYDVLTMCRLAQNVRAEVIGSKNEAAAWAGDAMPDWAWLIDEALAARASRGATGFESDRSRNAAVEFLRLIAASIEVQT